MMDKFKKLGASVCLALSVILGGVFFGENGNNILGNEVKHYESVADKKDYTIMIYMDGSNLESSYGQASKDIEEMISNYPIDQNVNIVCEAGGSEYWYTDELAEEGNTRFTIDNTGIKNCTKIEKRNMGEKDTLADFLNYGIESYPADKYILIFWNHGGGSVQGFGGDELFQDDSLDLSEMSEGFKESVAAKEQFELIGFDACLMSNIETANVLKDYSKYMIASEDLEPEDGWNYEWLKTLSKDSDGIKIGKEISEKYKEFFKDKEINLSLSLVDLSKISDFVTFLNSNISDNIEFLSLNRNNIKSFGNGVGDSTIGEMVDLKDLLINMSVSEDSDKLKEKLNNAVIYKVSKNENDLDSGLSIYLPVNNTVDLAKDYKVYKKNQFIPSYLNFIKKYDEFLLSDGGKYDYSDYELSFDEKMLKVNLEKDDIKNISTIYLAKCKEYKDNIYYYISTDSDVSIDKNGCVKSKIEDDTTFINNIPICTIEKSYTSEYLECLSPALLNDKKVNLLIKYDYYNSFGVVVGAVPVNEDDTNNKIIEVKKDDILIPLFPIKGEVDLSKINKDDLYEDKYIKGMKINTDDGYLDLSIGNISKNDKMMYGFIIVNNKQEYYETNFIE
ncbi:MAG: hypothetical protein E7214_14425 [Clostridium sp.]|nr:hypothetical protein [Clostridium sp.]